MRQGDVLVVGSVNVDLVVSVDRLPAGGETVGGGAFGQHSGGKGANQAVAAARLGARVTFVGSVGEDAFGAAALADLRGEGVDVQRASVRSDASTGVALIVVDDRGENQIAVAPGANALVTAADVTLALSDYRPRPAGVCLVSLELSDEAVLAAAEAASALGMRVVINPAPARPLPAALVALRPLLVPNEAEALALTGEGDAAAAARALAAQTSNAVVVTCGAKGALLVSRDGHPERLPAPQTRALDTTGAGDAFCGAIAAELAAGSSLEAAARIAVHAASLSVAARGARAGMPTRSMLG